TNISTAATKVNLLNFDLAAAANVELRKHTIVLCRKASGASTFANASDTTNGWEDVQNVQIINRDTGVAYVGPQDGSAFTTSNSTACPDGVTGASKTFTDTFNVSTGQTLHLAILADVKTANTTSGGGNGNAALSSGDVVKAVLSGYGTASGS